MKYVTLIAATAISVTAISCGGITEKIKDKISEATEKPSHKKHLDDEAGDDEAWDDDETMQIASEAEMPEAEHYRLAIKSESFGQIQLGMPTAWMQPSVDEFYDGYTIEPDEMTGDVMYRLHTVIPTVGTRSDGPDYIQMVTSDDEVIGFFIPTIYDVYAIVNDHAYVLPELTAGDIFSSGPAEAFHVYWMGICVFADNMTFFFDPEALTPSGQAKIDADVFERVTLTRSDFKPSAKPFSVLLGTMTFD